MAAADGDVLGDEFEEILPSSSPDAAGESLRPAELTAAPAGDEFEDILPSDGSPVGGAAGQQEPDEFEDILPSTPVALTAEEAGAAAAARSLAESAAKSQQEDAAALDEAMMMKRTQSNARYADKVKEKRRARGRTQGDFSRQAERAVAAVSVTHALPSHGTAARVLDDARSETKMVKEAVTVQKSASDKRYADRVAKKRLKRGLTEGSFSRAAHGRERKKRYCGFTCGQLVGLAGGTVLPILDGASDWVVTAGYAMAGEYIFLYMSLGIQLFMGMILGFMLAEELRERAEHRDEHLSAFGEEGSGKLLPCAPLWGCLLGMSGMSPAVQSAVNLKDKAAHVPHPRADIRERTFKSIVAMMALPQSVLQTFIGISYSRFDISSENFDPLLVWSVVISVIGSGANAVAAERLFRNEVLVEDEELMIGTLGVYGILTAIWRTMQTVALVGWIGLLCCSVQWWAIFPGFSALIFYVEMQKESDGQRKSVWPAVAWGTGFVLMLWLFSFIFFNAAPMDNNYLNTTAIPGPAGSAQNFDCQARSNSHSLIYICSWLSIPLMLLSLAVDPQHGWKLWRELEQAWIKQQKEQRYLDADEFSSPWFYARYMHTVCHIGMRVRAKKTVGSTVTGSGQIVKDDEGVVTRIYRNTCVCDWRHQCFSTGRRWVQWEDLEILTPFPTAEAPALLQGDFVAGPLRDHDGMGAGGAGGAGGGTPAKGAAGEGGGAPASPVEAAAHDQQLAAGTALAFIRVMDQKHAGRKWDPLAGNRYDASVHRAVTSMVSPDKQQAASRVAGYAGGAMASPSTPAPGYPQPAFSPGGDGGGDSGGDGGGDGGGGDGGDNDAAAVAVSDPSIDRDSHEFDQELEELGLVDVKEQPEAEVDGSDQEEEEEA
jgi:hypothetical protein